MVIAGFCYVVSNLNSLGGKYISNQYVHKLLVLSYWNKQWDHIGVHVQAGLHKYSSSYILSLLFQLESRNFLIKFWSCTKTLIHQI